MDIKVLQVLDDISQTQSVSATARRLGLSQSALSHSMKKMEKQWGIPLWKRQANGVALTTEAQQLLPTIRSILKKHKELNKELDAISGLEKGQITIGTYSSIAMHWLPSIISQFQEKYPGIDIRIQEGTVDEIVHWIQAGMVDFGFMSKVPEYKHEFIPLSQEPLYAVLYEQFPLKKDWKGTFPIEAFVNYPYIAGELGMDYDVSRAFQKANIIPPVRFTCREDQTIIAMVKNGLGISLLPSLMLKEVQGIQKMPLKKPVERTLGIGCLKEKECSLAARTFIQFATDRIKKGESNM